MRASSCGSFPGDDAYRRQPQSKRSLDSPFELDLLCPSFSLPVPMDTPRYGRPSPLRTAMSWLARLISWLRNPLLANMAARVWAIVALALATLLVARLGGPVAVGIFALFRMLPAVTGVTLSGGIASASPYFLVRSGQSDPRLRPTLVAIAAAGGTLGTAIWVLGAPLLAHVFFGKLPSSLVAWSGLRALTYPLCISTPRACSQGTDDLPGSNRVIVLEELLFLPTYAVVWALGVPGNAALVAAILLADMANGLLAWVRLARKGFFRAAGLPSFAIARRVYAFGVRGEIGSFLQLLNLRLDFALLSALAGPGTLGTYAIASKFAELLRLPQIAAYFVLLPRFSSYGPALAFSRARVLMGQIGVLTAVAAVPLVMVAAVIPIFFGEAFRSAIFPAQILLAGLASGGIAGVISAFLFGSGRPGLNSLSVGVGLGVNIVLDLLLIPRFGAVGAAIASSVAYLTTTALLVACFWMLTRALPSPGRQELAVERLQGSGHETRLARQPGISPSAGRRLLDVVLSVAALVVLWPLLLMVALAVRLSSPGPALFRQLRLGQGSVPFCLLKFRTISNNQSGSEITVPRDPRVTRLGRFLRATSLDELPQLINVLRGEMTLVGPRPETPALAARYPGECTAVFQYRPGLTGPAQLHLRDRDVLPTIGDVEEFYLRKVVPERVALDLDYLANPSVGRTVTLLAETVAYILRPARPAHRWRPAAAPVGDLRRMRRIMVVGVQGAGKSTLARQLGAILGIEVTDLDQLYWRPGWVARAKTEWDEIERRLVVRESWILDGQVGNALERSGLRLAAADTVIVLDRSPVVCLWQSVRRWATLWGQEVVPGCPVRIEWRSIPWILTYRLRHRPALQKKLGQFSDGRRILVLRTHADIHRFLEQMREAVAVDSRASAPAHRAGRSR